MRPGPRLASWDRSTSRRSGARCQRRIVSGVQPENARRRTSSGKASAMCSWGPRTRPTPNCPSRRLPHGGIPSSWASLTEPGSTAGPSLPASNDHLRRARHPSNAPKASLMGPRPGARPSFRTPRCRKARIPPCATAHSVFSWLRQLCSFLTTPRPSPQARGLHRKTSTRTLRTSRLSRLSRTRMARVLPSPAGRA